MLEKNIFELTNPQKNIWITEQYYDNTNINNICGYAHINQELNFDKLKEAINIVIKNNDSFNIKFFIENNILRQYLDEYKYYDVEILDVANEREVHRLEKEICNKIFNIENENLFEFKIFRFPNNHGGFIMNIHHLLSDSWSHGLACKEIIKIYDNLINNITEEGKRYSYLDYISKEKEYLSSDAFKKDKEYWDNMYNTVPEVATIPSVKEKANSNTSSLGKRKSIKISEELTKKINDFCKENKISIYNFFMSIFSIYISRVSNLEDFVIGTPILNRTNFIDKHTTGMFISTVPLRIELKESSSFIDFAKEIATRSMSMLRHQRYPYQKILEEIRKKDSNVPNLYNIVLSYQITKIVNDGVDYTTSWTFNGNCADDIQIHILDLNESGSLNISYDYKAQKYATHEIIDMHNRILCMIEQVMESNQISVDDIEIVTPEEKNRILYEFNNTKVDYPRDKTIIDLFEEQVEKNPENIAVVFENKKLTYRELNEKANSLARYLLDEGVERNDIISVCMNKTEKFIISILAIQKLGGAYLPIHPEYPIDRIKYILENSKSKMIIADRELEIDTRLLNIENTEIKDYKNNLNIKFKNDTLAYIIYTSGTTGNPKGVMLSHKNLVNFVHSFNNKFENRFNSKDKCLTLTNISFDVSVCEIFTPLVFGSTLVIYPKNTLSDVPLLCELLEKNEISFLYLPPNVLKEVYYFIEKNGIKSKISKLLVGVEAIKNGTLNKYLKLNPDMEIINGYGPTEATICSTFYKYKYNKEEREVVPIGKPLNNNNVYIVSKKGTIQPIGIKGELYVSGDNISKGYLRNKELTEKAFVNLKIAQEKISYKTGDIGYWNQDGNIVFIGREDSQIKLRGHRIELNGINDNIKNIPYVVNSITFVKKVNNVDAICSYVETNPKDIDYHEIKEELKHNLPYYMIPTYIIMVDKIPVNLNGKIDKSKLPEINILHDKNVKAETKTEKELTKILEKLLKQQEISIKDDFIELGLDSLIAIKFSIEIYNKFNCKINISEIFINNTIKKLSQYIEKNINEKKLKSTVEKIEEKDKYPLSSAQRRIYYASKMAGEDTLLYNVPGALLINKKINKEKAEKTFNEIIKRHSAFRTKFILEDGEIYQKISEKAQIKIDTFNNTEKEIKKIVNEFPKPFNLEKDLLLRVELRYIDNKKTLLLFDTHHIIADGTSLNILINEFIKLYNEEEIENIGIEYKDYAVWENNFINGEEIKPLEKYWLDKFKDIEFNSLNLPYDYGVPANRSYNGNRISKKLDEKKFNELEKYAKKIGVSPYMLFLSAFYVLLYKYTGQTELTLGSPVANREIYETKNLIGMFVNNIVTKAQIDSDKKFTDFVQEIKEQVLNDLENQAYPFDLLVKKLNIPIDNSKNPLFDVMFIYQNTENNKIIFDGEEAKQILADANIAKFNLSIEIEPNQNNINLEYATSLFKKETIERLYEHYINVLDYIIDNGDTKIKDIDILSEAERNKILYELNNTKTEYPKDKTIIQLFEEQVEKTPNNIAVVFEDKKLTYKELNEKANQLAYYLRKIGTKPNQIIGIMVNRSLELIVSMVGILKAGGTYLPIDPTYPTGRIEYMIKDSSVNTILTLRSIKDKVTNIENVICTDLEDNDIYMNNKKDNPVNVNNSEDSAYIIYTSGSTGNPKGVLLSHKNVNNFIQATCKKIKFKGSIVSVTTFCFDIFVLESLLPLQKGLTIVMANEQEQNIPKLLNEICLKNDVKMIQTTPARMQLLLSDDKLEYLKRLDTIMLGGEQFPINLLKQLKQTTNSKIFNMYGPTETTVWSTIKELSDSDEITIGNQIGNTQIYVLDEDKKIVPIGITGKLYIGGDGVSKGYLNREKLTKEKFIENPYINNDIIYDTGDIAKWNNEGELICIGREDFQVKIRGLRIELEEIENRILDFSNINKAVVCVKEDEYKRKFLCAYFTSEEKISVVELKEFLKKSLPNYMIPSHFIQLVNFKYTPNGKIDRKSLPMPVIHNENKGIILPETESELKVAKIFEELLSIKPISINDNFFEIGGDSILALRLQIELLNMGINILFSDIYKYSTIKQLGLYIDMAKAGVNVVPKYEVKEDFTEINNFIAKQNESDLDNLTKKEIGNVLLTGATGFLGAHILANIIDNTNNDVYCLIRENAGLDVTNKLIKRLNYYFNDKYYNLINKRIFVIKYDIEKEELGISKNIQELLNKNISCVINSAANVKHYGYYSEFEKINVKSVEKLIDFCNKYNKRFIQISTISVSGNSLFDLGKNKNKLEDEVLFKENNLYIGQSLENVYIRSKFEAEKIVLENIIKNNLDALILRIGNITNRTNDGRFQPNSNENAFANRIKAFIELKCLPEYLKDNYVEFSPVDNVAEAVIKSIEYYNKNIQILHIYNQNHVYMDKLVNMIPDKSIKIINDNEFEKVLNNKLNDDKYKEILSYIINDLDNNKKLIYESKIKLNNDFSKEFLNKIGFKWSTIDEKYIKKLLKNIGGNNRWI